MPLQTIILDPVAILPNRKQVSLNSSGINVDQNGIDWGESAIKAFMAEQLYGEGVSDYRIPNRIVTLPLGLGMDGKGEAQEEEARKRLQAKVALIQRQGGVLQRQRAGGPAMYADIVNASVTVPDRYGERGAIEPGVTLKLECLPDFYGNEVELDVISGTGQIVGVLKKAGANAVIAGDYPGRMRIVVTDTSGHEHRTMLWGLRSRYYSSSSRNALFIDAEEMTPINGATVVTKAGNFGGKCVELASPQPGIYHPLLVTDLAAGPLQHVGSYRVFARVTAAPGAYVKLSWSLDDATVPIDNPVATIPVPSFAPTLLDLGEVRLEEAPLGEHWWRGVISAFTNEGAVTIDRIWFQPIDDGAGKLEATAATQGPSSYLTSKKPAGEHQQREIATGLPGTEQAWSSDQLTFGAYKAQYFIDSTYWLAPGAHSKRLIGEGYGFAIPTTAVIVGIAVELVEYSYSTPYGQPQGILTGIMGLYKGGAQASFGGVEAKKFLPSQGSAATYKNFILGGSNDLWGASLGGWKASDFNAANFGVSFFFRNDGTGGKALAVTNPRVTVYYTLGASAVPTDAVLYAARKSEIRTEGAFREDPTSASYVSISTVLGALPRLPPSGLESAPVELFVKPSRGLPNESDSGIDPISAKVYYRPCYIGRI